MQVFFQYLIRGRLGDSCYNLILIFLKKQELLLQFWIQKEKHQSWKRGWINLPIALKFNFLEEIIFCKVYYLSQKAYWSWEKIWCLLFLLFSRLQKYYTTSFIWKIVWKKCLCICFFCIFSYRGKVIIKGICNIIRKSTVGTWDATVFWEIRDLIPFYVFLILFQLLSKYLS